MEILGKEAVSKKVNLSPTTMWRLEKAGTFPRRIQLGARRVGWEISEIDSWIEARPRVGRKK